MAKKKETIEDILDRIQEDMDTLRDKINDLENEKCDHDEDSDDYEDEDEHEEKSLTSKHYKVYLSRITY